MNSEAIASAGNIAQPRLQAADQLDRQRKNKEKVTDTPQASSSEKTVLPEEYLSQIKSITEDGGYSVRFESNENSELIVKIFDTNTDEVIRQIPDEEILNLRVALDELRGNIVDTQI